MGQWGSNFSYMIFIKSISAMFHSYSSFQAWGSRCLLVAIALVAGFLAGVMPAQATGVFDIPPLNPQKLVWVVDQAEVISFSNEGRLSKELEELAAKTGQEVRMVAVRRLNYGETVESFAEKLFEKWYPTPESQQNQVLVLMDSLTNNLAIRTGTAIAEQLPPEQADSVIHETIDYYLRNGDKYNQGFSEGAKRLVAILSGETDPGPPTVKEISVDGTFTKAEDTDVQGSTTWVIVLLVLATAIPMATYYWYVR